MGTGGSPTFGRLTTVGICSYFVLMRVPMISSYPADKIVVSCDKCGLRKRFDKAAMLKTGGDRPLGLLLDDIAIRANCPKRNATANIYDRCGIIYPELVPLMAMARRVST